MAVLFGAGGLAISLLDPNGIDEAERTPAWTAAAILAVALLVTAALVVWLDLWRWRISSGGPGARLARAGPADALVHLAGLAAGPVDAVALAAPARQPARRPAAVVRRWWRSRPPGSTPSSDRSLLLGLPALATLAAFALPTLRRSVAALIDWFTLLFFSGCAFIIWVVWVSMQTGVPAKPAANVAKLAPGFEPSFSLLAFAGRPGRHAGLGLAGALAHRPAPPRHLEKPGAAGRRRGPVLAAADDAVAAGARLRPQLRAGGARRACATSTGPAASKAFGLTRAPARGVPLSRRRWICAPPAASRLPVAAGGRAARSPRSARAWTCAAGSWWPPIRRPVDANDNVLLYRKAAAR